MPIISVTYASSPSSDLLISTLEFNNETAGVIRLAQSFIDVTATTELAETVTFIESAWEVSLPNKDATQRALRPYITIQQSYIYASVAAIAVQDVQQFNIGSGNALYSLFVGTTDQ